MDTSPPPAPRDVFCLVVEDHLALATALASALRSTGVCQVECAHSLTMAVAVLDARVVDLCLLDFQLPDGTALQLLPRLARTNTVTLVMTAEAGAAAGEACLEAGAWAFMRKPVAWAQVLRALDVASERVKASAGQAKL